MKTTNTTEEPGRLSAIQSWAKLGFNIGWDLGQAAVLFIPMGLLSPITSIAPKRPQRSKPRVPKRDTWWQTLSLAEKFNLSAKKGVKMGLLAPAYYLAHYLISPLLGALIGLISLSIGLVGGGIFNQYIYNTDYQYAMDVVKEHSATAVWGSLAMGVLLTYTALGGGLSIPGFSLFGLLISPFLANFIVPLSVAYALMAGLGVGQAIDRIYDVSTLFATHMGSKQKWAFHLGGVIKAKLKIPAIQNRTIELFQLETQAMAKAYTRAEDELRQKLERAPYKDELEQNGILNQWALHQDQLSFLNTLAEAVNETDKNQLLDQRQKEFQIRMKRA